MESVTFTGTVAQAVSPEGQKASLNIADLVKKIAPRHMDTGEVVLPDGVKCVLTQSPVMIWIHQTPPRIVQFKWIAPDSPGPFGRGAEYRMVKLALPYLIVLAAFAPGEHNRLQLSHFNECFFRNGPLNSLDDELHYPALLNCSKFYPPEGKPLSWICTQHLDRNTFVHETDTNRRLRGGLRTLLHCLLDTGFNYSSEHHEQSSWFTQSNKVDARVRSVETWQAASEKDPLFALEVPWLKTGLSVRQVVERTFKNQRAAPPALTTAGDVARLVFNHKPS